MHVGTGKVITEVALADVKDIDIAVAAAKRAMSESGGTKCSSYDRGRLLSKLADLYEEHKDEICAIEGMDTGMFSRIPDEHKSHRAELSGLLRQELGRYKPG